MLRCGGLQGWKAICQPFHSFSLISLRRLWVVRISFSKSQFPACSIGSIGSMEMGHTRPLYFRLIISGNNINNSLQSKSWLCSLLGLRPKTIPLTCCLWYFNCQILCNAPQNNMSKWNNETKHWKTTRQNRNNVWLVFGVYVCYGGSWRLTELHLKAIFIAIRMVSVAGWVGWVGDSFKVSDLVGASPPRFRSHLVSCLENSHKLKARKNY